MKIELGIEKDQWKNDIKRKIEENENIYLGKKTRKRGMWKRRQKADRKAKNRQDSQIERDIARKKERKKGTKEQIKKESETVSRREIKGQKSSINEE